MVLCLLAGLATFTYMGAKVHRCLHPRHEAVQSLTWTPSSLSSLELGVVAGSVIVRSCPVAKNVTLTVRTFASTIELLDTMVLQRDRLADGERVVLLAPSFDWAHCQRSVFELVVPEAAMLDLKAQGLLAHLSIRAKKHSLRHVVLATTLGHVDVRDSEIFGTLRIDTEVAAVRTRNVHADTLLLDQRVGYSELKSIKVAHLQNTLRIGKAVYSHVEAATAVTHASELAHVSMWDVATPALTARVDYGALDVSVPQDYSGSFVARSPFGFLKVTPGGSQKDVALTQNTPALLEGSVRLSSAASQVPGKAVTLDAVYGSVSLFVPDGLTRWERRRH